MLTKKKNLWFFAYCLILFFTSGVNASEPIVINNIEWPPFFFDEKPGKPKGIGKEVLEICLTEARYSFRFQLLPIKRTHLYMKDGTIDVCAYSYKKEREAFVIYGKEPLFSSQYRFLVNSDSDIHINSFKDLEPLKFGHLNGLTYTPGLLQVVKEKKQKNEVNFANSIKSNILQLIFKRNTERTFPLAAIGLCLES